MLRSILAALGIPPVVIEVSRSILDASSPVTRMEGHAVLRHELVYRRPPVELAHRRRIPGVAMRMVGVGDAGRKIVFGKGAAEPRHVLVRPVGRAAEGTQKTLYELLCTRVV